MTIELSEFILSLQATLHTNKEGRIIMAYRIKNFCLGCHNCALECPVGAIRYMGTQYQIDPDKCVECGTCVRICNVGAIDTGIEEVIVPHEPVELEADIVVIGAGSGGCVAAVRAAQSGLKVIVLEKAKKPGGSGWFAGFGINLRNDPAAEKAPKEPPKIDAQTMSMMKRDTSYVQLLDQELVHNVTEANYDFSEWVIGFDLIKEKLCEVEMMGRVRTGLPDERLLHNLKCYDHAIGPGRSGSYLIYTMLQEFDRLGITLLTEHEAMTLEKDENGAICGVFAKDPGGDVHVSCKAVVCMSGGFAHNDEMLRKYIPWFFPEDDNPNCEPVHRFAAPTDTGDVVRLGESVGAYIDEDKMYMHLFGPVHHPFSFSLFKANMEGEGVCVNLDGKRFFNEGGFADGAAVIGVQPGRVAYTVYTEKTLMAILERLSHGPEGKWISVYPADIEEELGLGEDLSLIKSDSLEDLARRAGINVENFLETIKNYNACCAEGSDPDFGKAARFLTPIEEGPFYAVFGKMATDGAFGGVLVDAQARVYTADKSGVIPGFYAAGDCAAGLAVCRKGPGDDRRKVLGDMGWSTTGGFMAGTNAAEYVKAL